jgi:hypothetical protein
MLWLAMLKVKEGLFLCKQLAKVLAALDARALS